MFLLWAARRTLSKAVESIGARLSLQVRLFEEGAHLEELANKAGAGHLGVFDALSLVTHKGDTGQPTKGR